MRPPGRRRARLSRRRGRWCGPASSDPPGSTTTIWTSIWRGGPAPRSGRWPLRTRPPCSLRTRPWQPSVGSWHSAPPPPCSPCGSALLALAQWLGDGEPALMNGLLLAAIFASATQPPRRATLVLVAVGALAVAPLLYGSMRGERPIAVAAEILLWWGLAILAMLWTARTRALRQQLQRERQRAHELAREDTLTGLGNRRALEEALAHEAARAARTGETVGVLLVDVDRFKSINDVHGHAAGDACLRAIGEALLGAVRSADSCFRWGGDEFVVLLPATDLVATREAAARAAVSVADRRAPDGAPMSASIGCAELRGDMTVDEVFAAADADLLAAKAARRAVSP